MGPYDEYIRNISYYEEDGFRFDFTGNDVNPYSARLGVNYSNSSVLSVSWAAGSHHYGTITELRVSKIDGSFFDLNSFTLVANTEASGGGPYWGEQTYIHALADGINISSSKLLPPEYFGAFGNDPTINVGSGFDHIKAFSFNVANAVDQLDIDDIFIEESTSVPEPAPFALLGLAFVVLGLRRHLARK